MPTKRPAPKPVCFRISAEAHTRLEALQQKLGQLQTPCPCPRVTQASALEWLLSRVDLDHLE